MHEPTCDRDVRGQSPNQSGNSFETQDGSATNAGRKPYHFPGHGAYVQKAARELGVESGALHQKLWITLSRVSELCAQASGRTYEDVARILDQARALRTALGVQVRAIDFILDDLSDSLPGPRSKTADPGSPAAQEATQGEPPRGRNDRNPGSKSTATRRREAHHDDPASLRNG